MSQTESTSDSDSNTSSSWIFVDNCPSDTRSEKNKYYLNCDSEPVQELTSQCLKSVHLEPETDSDGISIISESDDVRENVSNDEQPLIEDVRDISVGASNIVGIKEESYFNKYVIVGWILIAVVIPLLVNFFSMHIEEVLGNYNDNAVLDYILPKILTNKELYKPNNEKGAVQSCITKLTQKQVGESSESKKYDSKGEIDEHRMNCKGHPSVTPKITLKTKEWNSNNKKIEGNEIREDHSLMNQTPKKHFHKRMEKDIRSNFIEKQKIDNKRYNRKMDQKRKGKHSKTDILQKRKNSPDNGFPTYPKKKKKGKEKRHANTNSNVYTKEIKKLRKMLEGRDRDIKGLIKLIKAKDKQLKMLELRALQQLNSFSKLGKDSKSMEFEKAFRERSNNTNGEWYHKLHKGRSNVRKQQHVSDWVFDRAEIRSRNRNSRNNWYWNWMEDREQLRLRKGFWQFTY